MPKECWRERQCEGTCSQWFHCNCIFGYKLSTTQYLKIEASVDAWVCANCCGNQTLPHILLKSTVDVFHFDFQKNFQRQTNGRNAILSSTLMDLPFWLLLCL